MRLIIILFGLLIVLLAGSLVIQPAALSGFILEHVGKRWFQALAAISRLLLGVALILQSDASRYPLTLFVLGWVAVAAGIGLALVPPAWFRNLVHRAFERFGHYVRLVALAAVLFGVFLVHAVS
jgi:uncharacterized protein YjeT (DUF2065 family)